MKYTQDSDMTYHFETNPVVIPPGFGNPTWRIGDRVILTMTTLNPMSRGKYDGYKGTVRGITFCKSDGRTILYGIDFDTPGEGATGIRCEGFELDLLEDQTPPPAKVPTFSKKEWYSLKMACLAAACVSRTNCHEEQATACELRTRMEHPSAYHELAEKCDELSR